MAFSERLTVDTQKRLKTSAYSRQQTKRRIRTMSLIQHKRKLVEELPCRLRVVSR
jgi:hypothetical protein